MTWSNKVSRPMLVLVVALGVAAIVYMLALTPFIGDGYDDARYITLARSLAEGKGYRLLSMPDMPLETKYPPGWPLLLSLVWRIRPFFPANGVWFKGMSVLFTLGCVAVVYGWLRWRDGNEGKALLIALLTLFSPHVFGYGTSAFSEMAFAFFSLLALWLVGVWQKRPFPTFRRTLITALVVAFTLYLRMFGLALVVATLFYLLQTRRDKQVMLLVGLILVFVAPLLLRNYLVNQNSPYVQEFWLKSMEQPELGRITAVDLILRVVNNMRAYLLAGLPGAIFPSQVPLTYVNMPAALRIGAPWLGIDILLAMLVAGGLIGQILFRHALSDWYVAAYLGMALLWPWEPTRFMVPLIPLMFDYFWFELSLLGQLLVHRWPGWQTGLRRLAIAGVVLFILANGWVQALAAVATYRTPVVPPEWQARYRLFEWVKENTHPEDVLASLIDFQLYLYTDRFVVRELGAADKLAEYGVDYVVLVPYGGVQVTGDLSRFQFEPVRQEFPTAFQRVYVDEEAGIEVFRVEKGALLP